MLTTTFRLAKEAGACVASYKRFAKHVGGITKYGKDTPIQIIDILDVMGLGDALWCLCCTQEKPEADYKARIFAADCAEHVLHIYEDKYPDDKRPREAIQAARLFAEGKIEDAARAAAWAAAWDAARAVAWAATWAAARAAARDAARDAERKWQVKRFKEVLEECPRQ